MQSTIGFVVALEDFNGYVEKQMNDYKSVLVEVAR